MISLCILLFNILEIDFGVCSEIFAESIVWLDNTFLLSLYMNASRIKYRPPGFSFFHSKFCRHCFIMFYSLMTMSWFSFFFYVKFILSSFTIHKSLFLKLKIYQDMFRCLPIFINYDEFFLKCRFICIF